MTGRDPPLRVSLVATPEAQAGPLSGLYETLMGFDLLAGFEPDLPRRPFEVAIVGPGPGQLTSASGLPIGVEFAPEEVAETDIVIVPLMMVEGPDWRDGRQPALVEWLRAMHAQGATLCSVCTGLFLLAETELLDGREATLHWAFAPLFRQKHPEVRLHPDEVLVTSGRRAEFVMTGGVMSWHDLALHLIERHVGPRAAQGMARLMMLEWHRERQTPYTIFAPRRDHGDGLIAELQGWLDRHYMVPNPVEELAHRSGLPRRTLERRFVHGTGLAPLAYTQALRVEAAKGRLERGTDSVEAIGRAVGYENLAFFRRVFRRETGLTPGAYRRRFGKPS